MTSLRSTAVLIAVTAMSLGAATFTATTDHGIVMARDGAGHGGSETDVLLNDLAVAALGSLPLETLATSAPREQPERPLR